ncbi:hypothetical protein [Hydrogenophaga sp. 5NK40-0174]|uniref:hypothetical protein n=1 Tax=Hydrogenophaga sp. 5NK40-0174 TaxID=3127649 RepID=UPI003104F889
MSLPEAWHSPSHQLWLKGQQAQALQSLVQHINGLVKKNTPASARLYEQMGYYMFLRQQYPSALASLQHAHKLDPSNLQNTLNLAVLHGRLQQDDQAAQLSQEVLNAQPDNFLAHDALCAALYRLGRLEEASAAGTQALQRKDAHVAGQLPAGISQWSLPAKRPHAGQHAIDGKTNVVSFSLWGDGKRYLRGALRNAQAIPGVYPGWQACFHVDNSVPAAFLDELKALGATVIVHQGQHSLRERLCWRFEVANDPTVGYFLVRDTDSVVSSREAMAVHEWLAGDRHFHAMRDWWTHTDLVLAGMWGGVAGVLPPVRQLLARYNSGTMETPNIDQIFLRDCVWPLIRSSVCVHDRCFAPAGALPWPNPPRSGHIRDHIGVDEFAVSPAEQAHALAPWLQRLDWL